MFDDHGTFRFIDWRSFLANSTNEYNKPRSYKDIMSFLVMSPGVGIANRFSKNFVSALPISIYLRSLTIIRLTSTFFSS